MELIKKLLKSKIICAEDTQLHEENAETIVPDSCPDIARIVDSSGAAYVKDCEYTAGRIEIRGSAKASVLYVPDAGNPVKIDIPIAFEHKFDMSSDACVPSAGIMCNAKVVGIDARAVNPRKVSVRLTVSVSYKAYADRDEYVTDGISVNEETGYQLLTRNYEINTIAHTASKSFTLVEELELPGSCKAVRQILKYSIEHEIIDTRVMVNKLITKGNVKLSCLYENNEGNLERFSQIVPFSQIIDVVGASENMTCRIKLDVRNTELEPAVDMSGDAKFINLSVGLCAFAVLYEDNRINVLEDIYNTNVKIMPVVLEKEFVKCTMGNPEKFEVSETFETGMAVDNVLDCSVRYDDSAQNGQLVCVADVLYVSEDNGIYSVTRRIPVSLGSDDNWEIRSVTSSAIPSSNGLSVNITVTAVCDKIRVIKTYMVDDTELLGEYSAEPIKLSALLRYADEGETLWSIAKSCRTTVSEIAKANKLSESDEIKCGELLLIPIKR